jgi:YggT family protein
VGDGASGYEAVLTIVGRVVFAIVAVLAVVCLVDWLVRTRRIGPFNPVARFMRKSVDPLMAPVERRIVRAGGMPTAAPWWSLVFAALGGILLMVLLRFAGGVFYTLSSSVAAGPGALFEMLVNWTFGILRFALIVRVISSWIRISPYSKWIRWSYQLTEWLIRPLQRIVPTIGMIDITPIVAFLLLSVLQAFFRGLTGGM